MDGNGNLHVIYQRNDAADSKKGSVKVTPKSSSNPEAVDPTYAGPLYISRKIMDALGADDGDQIKITFEVVKD